MKCVSDALYFKCEAFVSALKVIVSFTECALQFMLFSISSLSFTFLSTWVYKLLYILFFKYNVVNRDLCEVLWGKVLYLIFCALIPLTGVTLHFYNVFIAIELL